MSVPADVPTTEKLATDIILAYLGTRTVEPDMLPILVRDVHAALTGGHGADARATSSAATDALLGAEGKSPEAAVQNLIAEDAATRLPPPNVADTIHPDYIICLEDGRKYKTLKRHLAAKYGLTPEQYRRKWGLDPDYPMVCENYARTRAEIATRTGLGKQAPAPVPASTRKRAAGKKRPVD